MWGRYTLINFLFLDFHVSVLLWLLLSSSSQIFGYIIYEYLEENFFGYGDLTEEKINFDLVLINQGNHVRMDF